LVDKLKKLSFSTGRKKDKVNKDLYNAHCIVAQEWGNLWHPILETVQDSTNSIMDKADVPVVD